MKYISKINKMFIWKFFFDLLYLILWNINTDVFYEKKSSWKQKFSWNKFSGFSSKFSISRKRRRGALNFIKNMAAWLEFCKNSRRKKEKKKRNFRLPLEIYNFEGKAEFPTDPGNKLPGSSFFFLRGYPGRWRSSAWQFIAGILVF